MVSCSSGLCVDFCRLVDKALPNHFPKFRGIGVTVLFDGMADCDRQHLVLSACDRNAAVPFAADTPAINHFSP